MTCAAAIGIFAAGVFVGTFFGLELLECLAQLLQ